MAADSKARQGEARAEKARPGAPEGAMGSGGAENGGAENGEGSDSEILIDPSSAISAEEQREIIAQISGIAEKNRRALSGGGESRSRRFKARKNGGLFPVLVNALALAALAGGLFALHSLQAGADAQAREGHAVFSDVERALIYEIRRETGALLSAKDSEINSILAALAGLETQMQDLVADSEFLTAEQLAAQERLMAEREERRAALAQARDERSHILEEARSREAILQAQLDARAREIDAAAQRHAADLGEAREELARLSGEQAQAAAVEAQVAGFFAGAHRQIGERDFDGASQTLAALREFLGEPAFLALRAVQARRELYSRAADALESLLSEYRATHAAMLAGALPPDIDSERILQGRVAELQGELAEARDAMAAGDAGAQAAIAQYRSSVETLQSANSALTSQVSALQGNLSAAQGSLGAQTQAAETLRQEAQTLQTANAELTQEIAGFRAQIPGLQQDLQVLRDHTTSRNSQVAQFRQALDTLEAQGALPPLVRQALEPIFPE